ncbi:hypothetical protein [Paenibacillus alvei]|uniref:hypothetical protein n=1 Tax=Paenibacillus alvei TaxID=44250 RepID=UPI0013D9CCE6|nr:hypothetical protein [Paenibacillus alvei]NEZ40348.1 hypothetical protein [Paenibacillus alvei]
MKKLMMLFFSMFLIFSLIFSNGVMALEDIQDDQARDYEVVTQEDGVFYKISNENGVRMERSFVTVFDGHKVTTMTKAEYDSSFVSNNVSNEGSITWNVVMDSTGGKMEYGYRITSITGKKPKTLKMTVSPQTGDYRYGNFAQYGSADFKISGNDIRVGKTGTKVDRIYSTRYWKFKLESEAEWSSGHFTRWQDFGNNYVVLLNKKGVEYPKYRDPQSGIILIEPNANLPVNPQKRGHRYREDLMEHYEKNYGKPTRFSWSDVEIHHMTPLKYGGSNGVYNLIPLWKGRVGSNGVLGHRTVHDWWDYY